MTEFADSAVNYVDIDGEPWGSFRLVIGGKDVTYFRGVPAQIGGYQLIEPYSYGPADFSLPQLSAFEVDDWGTGDLKWMGMGKPVHLKQVDASGALVRVVWRGFIALVDVTLAGTQIHCEGGAQGRLSMNPKVPDPFQLKRTVGRKIYDAFQDCRLNLTPYLGGDIGANVDGRGLTGGTYLDYVDGLLAATIGTDGSQYTIASTGDGTYQLALKDTTTVDFTVFLGAHGVDPDLSRDMSEEPNTIYGSGVAPEGLVWSNIKVPNLKQGDAPPYPMDDDSSFGEGTTDADTDTGDGITVMLAKLVGTGYLPRTKKPGGFDADVTDALEDLQDDAGLTVTGNMNTATWDALFDLGVTGFSLLGAYVKPLSQASKVRKWNVSSNGGLLSLNPGFDPSVIRVGIAVDHGSGVEKQRARKWSRGVLHRVQNSSNWAGTLTLTSDVFSGDVTHSGTPGGTVPMSRLDITAGMNMRFRNFNGGDLFHVSAVNVSSDLSVQLGIDTQARDAATLGEVIARNIESRTSPFRSWKRQRRANVNMRHVEFDEIGGLLMTKVDCPANKWTVFQVVAGQAGSVSRVRLQTTNDEAEFVLAITANKTSRAYWQSKVGNPFVGTGVSGVYVSDGGSSYETAPTVSFSGGGGTGAAATAKIGTTGTVTEIVLTDRGSGYTSAPTVTISGGGGTGAAAHTSVSLNDVWTTQKVFPLIDNQRALLGAWGDAAQPCGYHPGQHTNSAGEITDDPITGLFIEDAGIDYHTATEPVLYVAIYPDRDTTIKPQRILWSVEESD